MNLLVGAAALGEKPGDNVTKVGVCGKKEDLNVVR
jgi:hypothetical protein